MTKKERASWGSVNNVFRTRSRDADKNQENNNLPGGRVGRGYRFIHIMTRNTPSRYRGLRLVLLQDILCRNRQPTMEWPHNLSSVTDIRAQLHTVFHHESHFPSATNSKNQVVSDVLPGCLIFFFPLTYLHKHRLNRRNDVSDACLIRLVKIIMHWYNYVHAFIYI